MDADYDDDNKRVTDIQERQELWPRAPRLPFDYTCSSKYEYGYQQRSTYRERTTTILELPLFTGQPPAEPPPCRWMAPTGNTGS